MEDQLALIVIGGSIGLFFVAFAAVFLIVRRLGPGAPVVEVETAANEPWELRFTTTERRAYRLAARVGYRTLKDGLTPMGLEAKVHCTIDGDVIHDDLIGFHRKTSPEVTQVVTTSYMSVSGGNMTYRYNKGTYVLGLLPELPAGTEIVATGEFRPLEITELTEAKVWLGR